MMIIMTIAFQPVMATTRVGSPGISKVRGVSRVVRSMRRTSSSVLRRGVTANAQTAGNENNPRLKLPRWDGEEGICAFLNNQGLKSTEPKAVADLMKKGWVLVDVRRQDQFEESHAAGSENIELFQVIPLGGSARNVVKFLLASSQGATPVDPNPNFIQEVSSVLDRPGVKGVIFADAEGGCLDDADGRLGRWGCSSRSLVAAYRMLTEGGVSTNKIGHLQYGLNNWFDSQLPGAGEFEWLPEARTPSGGLGNSKYSAERREKLDKLPKWRRYLDAFGGLTYAEEAMRGNTRKRLNE